MRQAKIPKGNGKFRTVFVPDDAEMARLRAMLPKLTERMVAADRAGVAHGFFPGRSCVTNAAAHVGKAHTLRVDLRDFFDTVKRRMLPDDLRNGDFCLCWVRPVHAAPTLPPLAAGQTIYRKKGNGGFEMGIVKSRHDSLDAYFVVYHCNFDWENYASYTAALTYSCNLRVEAKIDSDQSFAGQGLPTSPLMANIAAAPMDEDLLALGDRRGRFRNDFVYTRYADDLTFSFDDPRVGAMLLAEVPEVAKRHGFEVNAKKTRWQSAKFGRRIVTGVAVDDKGLHPRREVRRRLRAARHQANGPQWQGLSEYAALKMPRNWKPPQSSAWQKVGEFLNETVKAVGEVLFGKAEPVSGGRRFKL